MGSIHRFPHSFPEDIGSYLTAMDIPWRQLDIEGSEARKAMATTATADARTKDLVRSFLMDLEHEYSADHRAVFEGRYGSPKCADDELARELDLDQRQIASMAAAAMAYARKWFGADGIPAVKLATDAHRGAEPNVEHRQAA